MTLKEQFTRALKKDWYTQGYSGLPLYCHFTAWSAMTMRDILGYGYSSILFHYKEKYGEMSYWQDDLKRLWGIVQEKLENDFSYLQNVKQQYDVIFGKHKKGLEVIDRLDLAALPDDKLLPTLKRCLAAHTEAVGIAHIIEAVGPGLEQELRQQLIREIGIETTKIHFTDLTAPSELSFVAQAENDLHQLTAQEYKEKYFWICTSYLGYQEVTDEYINDQLKSLAAPKAPASTQPKEKLISNLKLSNKVKRLIELIDFVTIWQDQRKANNLSTISSIGKVGQEIIKRTSVDPTIFAYLSISDIRKLESFADVSDVCDKIESRPQGTYFLWEAGIELVASGDLYKRLHKHTAGETIGQRELQGTTANRGTAIGRVVVCKNISQIHRVQVGDILVASMTRPEYMPALKKAAAIVTDEGGITSHAAIVSRELNIPAVIGTKVATKVLKDGMTVEVKANHGVVRIL